MMNSKLFKTFAFFISGLFFYACSESGAGGSEIKTEFYVRGNCDMCKERIETTVKNLDGVKTANWNVQSQMLMVQYDSSKTNENMLNKAVASVGHDTKLVGSSKETNDRLPVCCQKHKM